VEIRLEAGSGEVRSKWWQGQKLVEVRSEVGGNEIRIR
jgi:hypothetical protein